MQQETGGQQPRQSARPTVGIIGAGIGGLTAALALSHHGFEVDVFERAPQLTEVGGGVSISPNAVRVLQQLGLGPQLEHDGVRPQTALQRRWEDGRTLMQSALNPRFEEEFGAPMFTFHRVDLQRILASALPADRVHFGKRFTHRTDMGDHVEARFDTGDVITVDVLVGADGIRSAVRGALFGDSEAVFAGLVAYRGLVPIERLPDPEITTTSAAWAGPEAHFVHYPVAGGGLLNFVGWTENDSWSREDWTDQVSIARALDAFADWHSDVRQIISAAETCFIWALFDREPLPRWTVNLTTLLGDACHPMYPYMGQGAAQAIEDGAVLAGCLAAASAQDAPEALQRYETLRLPRVSLLQEMSRANKTLLHAPDGPAQIARDAAWAEANERFSEVMHWLYGYDARMLTPMDADAVQALLPRPN